MFEESITEAESRWYKPLFQHCRNQFERVFLPSHDHLHHARVWSNAKFLLLMMDSAGIKIPDYLPEQLLISVFFHDMGLARISGEQHGQDSRRLCEEYFRKADAGIRKPSENSIEIILYAIENHDDKSLKAATQEILPGTVPEVLSLLSASDDMDAFGRMGIYRYAEIYLLRGIAPESLPLQVCRNVENRYENLERSFRAFRDFIVLQESRYRQVYNFYLSLSQGYASRMEKPCWEIALIEIFRDSIAEKCNLLGKDRVLPETFFRGESEFIDKIRDWFNLLDQENPAS